jgi:HPt (histidine-containing phosphotransfer) domain-containing protein
MMTKAGELLDPAALENLRQLVGGDDSFLAELIVTFLGEAPQLLADLRAGIERGNADSVRLAAHSLKSNAADFGAIAFSNLCKELEMLGRSGMLDNAGDLLMKAENEYSKVKAALEAIINN